MLFNFKLNVSLLNLNAQQIMANSMQGIRILTVNPTDISRPVRSIDNPASS